MRRALRLLLVAILANAAAAAPKPKNVILLIGDGMGPAHFTALGLLRGKDAQFVRMKTIGFATTACLDAAVTDSAAGATALATGHKTKYQGVSVDGEGKPVPALLEIAEAAGKSTGLVTTANFWDATPAAFAAHAVDRYKEAPSILRQMLKSGADVILGGGITVLGTNDLPTLDEIRKSDYRVVLNRAELDAAADAPKVLGIFTRYNNDLDDPQAPLPVLAKFALEKLSADPDGFFLMIEHEGPDSSSHENANPDLRKVLVSFDTAIGIALDFAAKRNDTLVVVTSDHETGGLRISETRERRRWRMEWSTGEHTGTSVPVFAFGPGAEEFGGYQDNTDVGRKLIALQK
jgi:alkaline phosphatase